MSLSERPVSATPHVPTPEKQLFDNLVLRNRQLQGRLCSVYGRTLSTELDLRAFALFPAVPTDTGSFTRLAYRPDGSFYTLSTVGTAESLLAEARKRFQGYIDDPLRPDSIQYKPDEGGFSFPGLTHVLTLGQKESSISFIWGDYTTGQQRTDASQSCAVLIKDPEIVAARIGSALTSAREAQGSVRWDLTGARIGGMNPVEAALEVLRWDFRKANPL